MIAKIRIFGTMHQNHKRVKGTTQGSTAKGDESPTNPPVNEAVGRLISNPSLVNTKDSTLSDTM